MAEKTMILTEVGAKKALKYRTRMLSAGDPITLSGGDARLYTALGWAEDGNPREMLDHARDKAGMKPLSKDSDDIASLRAEYQAKFDKRPFNGWSAAQLKEKIAEA